MPRNAENRYDFKISKYESIKLVFWIELGDLTSNTYTAKLKNDSGTVVGSFTIETTYIVADDETKFVMSMDKSIYAGQTTGKFNYDIMQDDGTTAGETTIFWGYIEIEEGSTS
jgi:hypothetical protein